MELICLLRTRIISVCVLLFSLISPLFAQQSFQFNGTGQYGQASPAWQFAEDNLTLECWFIRTGEGRFTSTGAVDAVPLLTRGRDEGEGGLRDINYFIGIDEEDRLVFDFEEAPNSLHPGRNHPLFSTSRVIMGEWMHVAVTIKTSPQALLVRLLVNGKEEASLFQHQMLVNKDGRQKLGVSTAFDSNGVPAGGFAGFIDEVRVWRYARSKQEIAESMFRPRGYESGLLALWNFEEIRNDTCINYGRSISRVDERHLALFGQPQVGRDAFLSLLTSTSRKQKPSGMPPST